MHIYLAGRPGDHEQIQQYASSLTKAGSTVVSTWHHNDKLAKGCAASVNFARARGNAVQNLQNQFAGRHTPELDTSGLFFPPDLEEDLNELGASFEREAQKADCLICDLADCALWKRAIS
jgi:hypothetical protein